MKPIAIYGAGGLGKEVLALIKALPDWKPVCFYDDQIQKGTLVNGIEIRGGITQLKSDSSNPINLVIAIGNPEVKKKLLDKLKDFSGLFYPVLVHPSAVIMDLASTSIGEGTLVGAGCILTTNISVGAHVLINIKATIGHDCKIGDYASIMPGVNLAGRVNVGSEALIGSGANVMNGISLGDRCRIGMGTVVLKNVDAGITAVGVPAKSINKE